MNRFFLTELYYLKEVWLFLNKHLPLITQPFSHKIENNHYVIGRLNDDVTTEDVIIEDITTIQKVFNIYYIILYQTNPIFEEGFWQNCNNLRTSLQSIWC